MKRDIESEKTKAQHDAISAKLFVTPALADSVINGSTNTSDRKQTKRHFNDPPTIREMLDKMEEHRTCNAPCLVAMLRLAVNALEEYDDAPAAREALKSIELGLWATAPEELWYEPRLPMTEKEARACVDLMNREP